jgi:transposase
MSSYNRLDYIPEEGIPMPPKQDRFQTTCRECGHEIYLRPQDDEYIYCPECGAKLNEYSSEDAEG